MRVILYHDGFVKMETAMDYLKDGMMAVENATAEKKQFCDGVCREETHDTARTA